MDDEMDVADRYNIDPRDFEPHIECPECGSDDVECVEPEGEMGFTWIEGHIECNNCPYVGPAADV